METNLSVYKWKSFSTAICEQRNRSHNNFINLRDSDSWFIIQTNQCFVLVNPEVDDLLARVENTKCLVRFHIFPKLQTYNYDHSNHNIINIIDLGKDITISLINRPDWIPPRRGTRPCQDQTCWMPARPVYVRHRFHFILAFWFVIFSSTLSTFLLTSLSPCQHWVVPWWEVGHGTETTGTSTQDRQPPLSSLCQRVKNTSTKTISFLICDVNRRQAFKEHSPWIFWSLDLPCPLLPFRGLLWKYCKRLTSHWSRACLL